MAHGITSRLIFDRELIFTRIKQTILAVILAAISVGAALVHTLYPWNYAIATGILAIGGLLMLRTEIRRVRRSHHFMLFPPGRGTLGHRTMRDNERSASLWELWTWRYKMWPGAIRYGRLLPEHRVFWFPRKLMIGGPRKDPRHVITIAGAQSGKGRGMLIPNLLLYRGSAVIIDPKGQLAAVTANARGHGSDRVKKFLGQQVFILDPENIVKNQPVKASFNPMRDIHEDDPESIRHAKVISEALIPPTGSDAQSEFFVKQARALLEATILHVVTMEPEDCRHLVHVRTLLTIGDVEGFDVLQDEYAAQNEVCPVTGPIDALIYLMTLNEAFRGEIQVVANRLMAATSEQRADILGELANNISFIGTPGIREILDGTAGPEFSIAQLREKPSSVYVCMSNTALQRQERNLLRLMVELSAVVLERVKRKSGDWPVMIAMDEFYSLGYMKTIDVGMGAFPGYGIMLWPVVQSLSQLKELYPKTWENMLLNCRAQQFFGQLDPETHRYLSQRLAGLYSPTELANNVFASDDRRQIVLFADRPATLLKLALYDQTFSKSQYDKDPFL
ncbi:type IV secretory system conjugative DNA transfer family protein [Paraburkholderia agricolaris]|uniref:Type IV secretory system conjugative DNA transfer family protein n=1 Tax=Paraburkholderia agricolaris TaxID=2152888 RepID=A0ABW8ZV65_9BURK